MMSIAYIVAAFLISVGLIVPSFHLPLSDDAFFELVGREMIHGRSLYSGIWDNKPPTIYLINALWQLVFGERYYLHRVAEYAVTLVSIAVFARIVYTRCSRLWAPATLIYALFVSLPGMAFLNYSQQYAMLPALLAVLLAMRQRPIEAGVMHAAAVAFWQPAILISAPMLLWLNDRESRAWYCISVIGALLLATAAATIAFSPGAMHDLLHDMASYQARRTQRTGFLVTEIRQRLLGAVLVTGLVYPLLGFAAVLRSPKTRDEVAAVAWFSTAFAGGLTNLNFSAHYFYPVVAPTVYAMCLFANVVTWRRSRMLSAALAAVVAVALLPRTFALMRHIMVDNSAEARAGDVIAREIRAFVPTGGTILVYGYLPEVYLRAERAPTGRYANYLALRADTVSYRDRTQRVQQYVADVRRSSAFVRLDSDVVPARIQKVVDANLTPVCSNLLSNATVYVASGLVNSTHRCSDTDGKESAYGVDK